MKDKSTLGPRNNLAIVACWDLATGWQPPLRVSARSFVMPGLPRAVRMAAGVATIRELCCRIIAAIGSVSWYESTMSNSATD
jgi:hypothetical protein